MSNDPLYHDTTVVVKLVESGSQEDWHGQTSHESESSAPSESKKRKRVSYGEFDLEHDGEIESGCQAESSNRQGSTAEYNAVAFSLASCSAYFRSVLERWSDIEGSRKVIELQATREEATALKTLLGFIHSKELPVSLPEQQLLNLLLLADRYMVDKLVPLCCKKLIQKGFDSNVASQILTMFDTPRSSVRPGAKYLLEAADKVLLKRFPDLEAIWRSPSTKRSQFKQLPLPAVKSLLMSEGLSVGSEETVFWAVSGWLHKHFDVQSMHPGNEIYMQAALELGNCIRFPQMAGSYLHGVVHDTKWMQDLDLSSTWVEDALEFQSLSPQERNKLKQQSWRRDNRFSARPVSPSPDVFISWTVGPEEFYRQVTSQPGAVGSSVRYKGYCWNLVCSRPRDLPNSSEVLIGLFVTPPKWLSSLQIGWAGQKLQVPSDVAVKKVTFQAATRSGIHHEASTECNEWKVGEGHFVNDFFRCSLDSVVAPDSAFLVDGQLHLSVKISMEADRASGRLGRRFAPVTYMEIAN